MLYCLILTDEELSYGNHTEDFTIGYFESREKAESIAEYYINKIKGFCDFPCTYKIIEKNVVGDDIYRNYKGIYIVQGWDIDENLDEVDIVESSCFVSEFDAIAEREALRKKYYRQEWTIDYWLIGNLDWSDGFYRLESFEAQNA